MDTKNTYQDIRMKRRQILKYIIIGMVSLFTIMLLVSSALYTVPAGYVGIVTRWGAVQRIVQPGLGVKIPLAEAVHRMSAQTQKDEIEASSASSNLQTVSAIIAVNYRLDNQHASAVYQSIGTDYQDKVVAPAIQNAFKSATAKYTAENLIKMREQVRIDAETELQKQLEPYHIIVENFNIINFDFSPEYNASIEAKQVMEQNVQTAKLELEKSRIEAEQRVVEAQAQADAQKALKDTGALTDAYLQYLFLTRWNGILPDVIGGANPVFDIGDYLPQE
ncbi:MAG: prohibitin family protein [Brevefilum sp.]|nr:prohibitin family protein [Brevefilum sp.]MDT8381593.1 prohibitin family protein [Brevefilum sp.]